MNEDNLLDSLKLWYEHYHDVKEGKPTYTDVKVVTELAGSIIYQMNGERARICEKLGLENRFTSDDILAAIDSLLAARK